MEIFKDDPLVSVIINCRNGEKYLKQSLKSVIYQSYKKIEILFYDNNSSDNSIKIANKFRNKDNRIKIFLNKKKTFKLYKARNEAIKKAKGKYISFIDVDDIWNKNKLFEQIKVIRKNPEANIIYSNYENFFDNKKKKILKYKLNLPSGYITQKLLDNYCVIISSVIIKTQLLKSNKFNEKYNIIGDFDLIIRLSKKYKIFTVQKSLLKYRIHNDNFSLKNISIYIDEYKNWLKINNSSYYDFFSVKYILFKLNVKNYLNKFLKIY